MECIHDGREPIIKLFTSDHNHFTMPECIYVPVASKWCAICRARSLPNRALKMYAGKSGVDCGDPISPNGITVKYNMIKRRRRLCYFSYTVERRLSKPQSSETSNIQTHVFFVLRSNNEKSATTSCNKVLKVLCHFY